MHNITTINLCFQSTKQSAISGVHIKVAAVGALPHELQSPLTTEGRQRMATATISLLLCAALVHFVSATYFCSAPVIPHGRVYPSSRYHYPGAKIDYVCDDGYYLHGEHSNLCILKEAGPVWAYNLPICKRKHL